jgi:Protein of unknown function (DUF3443)
VSSVLTRSARAAGTIVLALCAVACGGHSLGGSSTSTGTVTPASNVVNVSVSAGPAALSSPAINTLYTTVTVCVPGTTTCQTIDNIQVDTGSYGLRILAPVLTLTLAAATTSTGSAVVECTEFVDGYSWGPVALVDVQISGETASSVPVQLIGDSRYPTVPADCSNGAPASENTVASFGANGILGIGPFVQDCGNYCVSGIPEPAIYYACSTSVNCTSTTLPLASQVQNPVTLFATDNNGTIISLPNVADAGASDVAGSLIFGVGTESNNSLGTVSVVPIAISTGFLTTVFGGTSLPMSFIDSGSNAMYFNDSNVTACTGAGFTIFYCPASEETLSGEFELADNSTVSENFLVVSAETVPTSATAFPGLAGTNPAPQSFDWGLPFFFGRQVATVIQGYTTADGTGPYIAF